MRRKMVNELCLQEIADLFGCYACVNKYEEDRILLFDRYPYYNKDSGVYGGRCVGWVSNQDKVAIPMVATPRVIRRPGVRNLIDRLDCTLVIGPEQTVLYSRLGGICGAIATKSLLCGIGVSNDEGKIVCHRPFDMAL